MKRIIIFLLMLIMMNSVIHAKIGIHIVPAKSGNKLAREFGMDKTIDRIIERSFGYDLEDFTIRAGIENTLKELEQRLSGEVEDSAGMRLEAVDNFIIPVVSYADDKVICDIRAMDAESTEVIYSIGFIGNKKMMEDQIEESTETIKEKIKSITDEKTIEKETISIYKVTEEGQKGLAEAVSGIIFSRLKEKNEFKVIEREGAKWARQEKVIQMAI